MNELEKSPKTWPPLGLPTGSVRALLTLIVIGVVINSLVRNRPLDVLWSETLLIALAHYFTSRRFVALPAHVIRKLEQDGLIESERQPLYLPKHSIRFLIFAAFVGVAVYLYQEGRLFDSQVLSLLGIVYAYLLGAIGRGISHWIRRRDDRPASRLWVDGKAVIALLALIIAAVPELAGVDAKVPSEVHKVALGLMLFYFGAR